MIAGLVAAAFAVLLGDHARVLFDGPMPAADPQAARLELFVGEVGALQVIVDGGASGRRGLTLRVPEMAGVRFAVFVEHPLAISERSHSKNPLESLGWLPAARPADQGTVGLMPDALVPIERSAPWRPYPLDIPAGQLGGLWLDVSADEPGEWRGELLLRDGSGQESRLPLTVVVRSPRLPARAVSIFIDVDPKGVARRQGGDAAAAEKSLWGVLSAHGLDPLGDLSSLDDLTRLRPALEGAWTDGRVPQMVAIGTYGHLGEPSLDKAHLVRALAAGVPAAIADVFLYAIDEDCASKRPADWKRALGELPRVMIGATCSQDPAGQPQKLVMMVAQRFSRRAAESARKAGKRLWIYNGQLPQAPTLLLDAPPSAAMAFGWVAAARPVERWFLWASTFWDDGNRGGHGPVDPYVTAASFHNADGDVALGDGNLLYPGRQVGSFAAHSLDTDQLMPSMRLKRLRRGLQDAALIALAAHHDPVATRAIVDRVMPRAFDEVGPGEATPWEASGASFATARTQLRAMVPDGTTLDDKQTQAALRALRDARPLPPVAGDDAEGQRRWPWLLGAVGMFLIAALLRRRLNRR